MATLSHEAFRKTIEDFGFCDEYYTEMINAGSLLNMGPFEKYYLLNESAPQKMVWQITGSNGEKLAEAADFLAQKDGCGIDLNMGCSAPQIYKTGAGISWMLKDLKITREAVRGVKKVLKASEEKNGKHIRLSVKCRLGGEDFTQASFFSFTDMLAEEGVELIALHPRTIKEKYRGEPKYEWLKKLTDRYGSSVKIVANGNIKDSLVAKKLLDFCPELYGLMIAREAAVKPWIFLQIATELESLEATGNLPSEKLHKIDRLQCAQNFIDYLIEFQPEEFYKTRLQRFFSLYCQQFQFSHYFESLMLNFHSIEESRKKLKDYFLKQPEEQFLYF